MKNKIIIIILILLLIVLSLVVVRIYTQKREDYEKTTENKNLENDTVSKDIYIEFGYREAVAATVYPAPEGKRWKYIITKEGLVYYYSNFERGKEIKYTSEDKNKGEVMVSVEKLGGDIYYDYQSKIGETFIKQVSAETLKKIEDYAYNKISENNKQLMGSFYIKLMENDKETFYSSQSDWKELERIINE